ncbi:LOW QUALITY PROTEIN: pleckstrin homology-like domain family B member 3 [Lampetra planeri]
MPQSNMESSRSQWQQGLRSPWIIRVAESPASSGAESDTESSSTESERSCVKKLEVGSLRVLSSPSKLHQRITEIDQQKEELKIELQLEIALLQGELQTEKNQLLRHTQKLQALQQEARQGEKQRNDDRQTERQSLEEERQRVDELKKRCEEKEKALAAQPENERKQQTLQLQQEKEVMEAAVRAFEDWEFRVLEQESGIDEEDDSAEDKVLDERKVELEKEICCQQHAMTAAQERVQQLETQLMDMEKEKESELNALRKEKRDLMHTTQTVFIEKTPLTDGSNITGSTPCVMSHSPLTVHKSPQDILCLRLPSVTGTDPGTSSGVGLITPCNSTASSRAASPCLLDLMEIERKLREAKAERERLLRERRSLPLSLSPNFDLRSHVESLGHGVAGCSDLRLDTRRCAGFLTKRGGRVKTWKKRWFLFDMEFDMDHRRLAYYTDCDERKLKGVIYFQAIEEVYYDHLRTATSSPRPSLTFCVKTYDRLFFLVASNAVSMRIWMDVIVTATDEHSRY